MRASRSAVLFAVTVTFCFGDERTVMRATGPQFENVTTHWVQRGNQRWETLERRGVGPTGVGAGMSHTAGISLESGVEYRLDLKTRQYVEFHIPTFPPFPPTPRRRFGTTTIDVYFETIDTGETKEFFGRQAKHLILRQREVAEPGSCRDGHVFETDGWYFPKPANAVQVVGELVSNFNYSRDGKTCRGQIVYHRHPTKGVVVKESTGPLEKEMLEFSTEPLDPSLFVPPSGFEKVATLPGRTPLTWSDKVDLEWADLVRDFKSWFLTLWR